MRVGYRTLVSVSYTHLFLKPFPSVCFRFFEIDMTTGEPRYTYRLREGVSDERIGMYILKKAGVVDLIESL